MSDFQYDLPLKYIKKTYGCTKWNELFVKNKNKGNK